MLSDDDEEGASMLSNLLGNKSTLFNIVHTATQTRTDTDDNTYKTNSTRKLEGKGLNCK